MFSWFANQTHPHVSTINVSNRQRLLFIYSLPHDKMPPRFLILSAAKQYLKGIKSQFRIFSHETIWRHRKYQNSDAGCSLMINVGATVYIRLLSNPQYRSRINAFQSRQPSPLRWAQKHHKCKTRFSFFLKLCVFKHVEFGPSHFIEP